MTVHLLLQTLGAVAQRLERSTLRVDRSALALPPCPPCPLLPLCLAALEVAFGFFHVALRVVEALLALHAEALELTLQFGETVAQLLLAIAELGGWPLSA